MAHRNNPRNPSQALTGAGKNSASSTIVASMANPQGAGGAGYGRARLPVSGMQRRAVNRHSSGRKQRNARRKVLVQPKQDTLWPRLRTLERRLDEMEQAFPTQDVAALLEYQNTVAARRNAFRRFWQDVLAKAAAASIVGAAGALLVLLWEGIKLGLN